MDHVKHEKALTNAHIDALVRMSGALYIQRGAGFANSLRHPGGMALNSLQRFCVKTASNPPRLLSMVGRLPNCGLDFETAGASAALGLLLF